jgi:hypothetical protein
MWLLTTELLPFLGRVTDSQGTSWIKACGISYGTFSGTKVSHAILHLGMLLQVPHVLDARLPNRKSSLVKKVGGGMCWQWR